MANVQLTPSQKDEIRRLTQLANRRIKNVEKAYAKEGKKLLPSELVGDFQIREKWQTKANPLSRSVKFETTEDYNKQLRMLREFETRRIGIKEYTSVQREKTAEAVKTALGLDDLPDDFTKRLNKMSAPQLGDFWQSFTNRATRMGTVYSSESAMLAAVGNFFGEDVGFLLSDEMDKM